MDQDNENRTADSARPPVENDLFAMTEPAPEPVPAVVAEETAVTAEPSAAGEGEGTPSVGEPEFKVNTENLPPVRMLHENRPVPEKPMSAVNPEKSKNSLRSERGASLGTMLAEARNAAGLSIREVSLETRIRADYIEALEADKIDSLPNVTFLRAYLRAYVRSMIRLYHLDADSTDLIEEQLEGLEPPPEVPEKLLEDIGKDAQISETETRRIKMILIYGVIILLLLISLAVTSIVSIHVRNRNARRQIPPPRQTEQPFDSSRLENLLPPQLPRPMMLNVPPPEDRKTGR